jgi:excisionase family DNA binding protein
MDNPEPWLTITEVAAHLKVHPNTVRRLINTGRLPAVRLGGTGHIRIATHHLNHLLHTSRITPPHETPTAGPDLLAPQGDRPAGSDLPTPPRQPEHPGR